MLGIFILSFLFIIQILELPFIKIEEIFFLDIVSRDML